MLKLADDWSCSLPGDDFLDDPAKQITRTLEFAASVELVWPELVAMVLDRHGQVCTLLVGEPPRAIVLGGLYDHARGNYVEFDAPRPKHFWHATWALVLSRIGAARTRLDTRSRVAFTPGASCRCVPRCGPIRSRTSCATRSSSS